LGVIEFNATAALIFTSLLYYYVKHLKTPSIAFFERLIFLIYPPYYDRISFARTRRRGTELLNYGTIYC
jgi:hypothetical protein